MGGWEKFLRNSAIIWIEKILDREKCRRKIIVAGTVEMESVNKKEISICGPSKDWSNQADGTGVANTISYLIL